MRFLQVHGRRITEQRQVVCRMLASRAAIDQEDLLGEARMANQPISRATVFRVVSELVGAGLLKKSIVGGRAVFLWRW
jgi:Fe2+ or Zn2+ uptake regulation protein